MSAELIEVAEAVVAALNDATLSQAFTAVRAYVPVHDAEEIDDLEVSVVFRAQSLAMLTRGSDDFDYTIDVGVQKRIGEGSLTPAQVLAATDPLMVFVGEVLDLFRGQRLEIGAYGETALCVRAANEPVYFPPHLDQHRVFTSVVTLVFRNQRGRG